jgi:hypothetical protein
MTSSTPRSFTNTTTGVDFTPTLSTTTQSSPYVDYFLCAYQVSVLHMLKVMQDFMKKQEEKIPESSRNQLSSTMNNKEKENIMC